MTACRLPVAEEDLGVRATASIGVPVVLVAVQHDIGVVSLEIEAAREVLFRIVTLLAPLILPPMPVMPSSVKPESPEPKLTLI